MVRFASSIQLLSVVVVAAAAACSSSTPSGPTGPAGGPATGAADTHCAARKQPTEATACHPDLDAGVADSGGADAGPSDAATDAPTDAPGEAPGDATADTAPDNPYGPTMFGVEADDDDCKYHLQYTVDPVYKGQDVYFHLTAMKKSDGLWAKAAAPRVELFQSTTHPAPNTDQRAVESSPGKYDLGPLRFDASGRWTARFHLYEDCSDLQDTSPHGHAAFYVDVP
ncbi:MAG: hypothetical protein NVSMB47_09360 [Polyangiales bacterium]